MTLAMSSIPKEKMGNATSILNLMRNIGGSFGIAITTTFLARRNQFHQTSLAAHITASNLKTREVFAGLRAHFHSMGFDSVTGSRKAAAVLYGMVQQHAAMLSFVEAFWIMALMFLAMLPFVLMLRRPKHHAEAVPPATAAPTHREPASTRTQEEKTKEEEEEEAYELLMH